MDRLTAGTRVTYLHYGITRQGTITRDEGRGVVWLRTPSGNLVWKLRESVEVVS